MKRELLLLRHGKSDWSKNVADMQRPLTVRGKRAAQRIGTWLAQQRLIPDLIVTSPALRAMETTQKTVMAMELDVRTIVSDKRTYEADQTTLLTVLQNCPAEAKRILLVGHNPGLDRLLIYLADDRLPTTADGKLMTTAALVRLQMPEDWSALPQACAKLLELMRPTSLPQKFPFPLYDPIEFRDRPAYYYRQSSVIPYRLTNGQPEILLITSSKAKRWLIPKGIITPGLSAPESARKEAYQKVGVEGDTEDCPIGVYAYKKWGGTCHVHVYPMQVTRVLPDFKWPENYRRRSWMTPEAAVKNVKSKGLQTIIEQFIKSCQGEKS